MDALVDEINSSGRITDQQAESLSQVKVRLWLNGLTTITDQQAKSLCLSKAAWVGVSPSCRKLIDKYKKQ